MKQVPEQQLIAHSVVKEKDPIKVGSVATIIPPFVDTILVSLLTFHKMEQVLIQKVKKL